ncbi:MAG: tRNA preQ1(34) S-adenosylmethionine ribosyltransferase-isomerase QueA [Limisphaerales bacterium]|jgi:S-adenosylmethionine:tRNA ribosyltransferase-isomerase
MGLTSEYDYYLPEELIAQYPAQQRGSSRLLVVDRKSGKLFHRSFPEIIEYLEAGDTLVLNDSKVIAARLRGANAKSGGEVEVLLVEQNSTNDWWTMLKPGRRARVGGQIQFYDRNRQKNHIIATVVEVNEEGMRRLVFQNTSDILDELDRLGEPPIPPYIRRAADFSVDVERYQTVFARIPGSVAAPTAGLHFSEEMLKKLVSAGIQIVYVTLHIGVGTFAPVKSQKIEDHKMHEERFEIPKETAEKINTAKAAGRRILCVGTTSIRTLESAALQTGGIIEPMRGKTRLFIYPPFDFKVADMLLTNFHLPRSTLLMLVCAFASPGRTDGKELIFRAYNEAIKERYRFYSYGDAMLII